MSHDERKTRSATIKRTTGETDIALTLDLDGSGQTALQTGVPFLTHMLDLFAKHGQFDLQVTANGDTDVDDHHTTEDIAICMGQAIHQALGNKYGIRRYGDALIPMDESLGQVVIDLSNRPHLAYRVQFPAARVGTFDTELVHEFFWKLSSEARCNLHVIGHYGHNTHHLIESLFKALGRALDEATGFDPRVKGVPSSKGVL